MVPDMLPQGPVWLHFSAWVLSARPFSGQAAQIRKLRRRLPQKGPISRADVVTWNTLWCGRKSLDPFRAPTQHVLFFI